MTETKFAYWVPNVSGGLVTSTIEQRTDWGYEYNRDLARIAEDAGFEYALSQVRYTASYGAEYQHESTSFSLALLLATERLKVIAAVHPGPLAPGRARQVGRDRGPPLRRARRRERRVRLVPGRVPPARGALARARRALPAHRGVHHRAQAHLDGGRGEPRGRLLPHPRLLAEAEAALVGGTPAPRDLPGRQLERGAAQRRHALGLVLLQREGLRRRPRAARRPARARRERRADRRAAVRPQRLRHRPRHRGRGARHAARDHRQGARRGGRGLRLRRAAGRAVDGRPQGHVGGLELRGPRPVQRRLPHAAHRDARAGRGADRGLQADRRRSHPRRLPALPRGGRALRPRRHPDRARARGAGGLVGQTAAL